MKDKEFRIKADNETVMVFVRWELAIEKLFCKGRTYR